MISFGIKVSCILRIAVSELEVTSGPNSDSKYRDYHSFSKELCYIRSHQYLAIARAEKEKCLKVSIHLGRDVKDEKIQLERALNFAQNPYSQPLVEALTK